MNIVLYFSKVRHLSVCRRICDEDDDLAEVTPDTVPDEVREWLAATFTRQTVQTKREKPKFKSVANAIRTGIFFDKSVQWPAILLIGFIRVQFESSSIFLL